MIDTAHRRTGHPARRTLVGGVTAAVLAAGGLVAIAVAPTPAAAGTSCAAGTAIGIMGPLSGANGRVGSAIARGASLAVTRHNKANPACQVRVIRADTQGDPARAPRAASDLVATPSVLGVVGPGFSGETLASGTAFARARLVTITPSATNPVLGARHWPTFFRATISDTAVGAKAARLLTKTLRAKRICIVRDGSDYGATSAAAVSRHLGKRRVCTVTLTYNRPDYRAAARTIKAKRASAVYFAGYDVQAAALVRALRSAKFRGKYVTGDGAYSSLFVKRAGKAGRGAYVVSGTAPGTVNKTFTALYRATYRTAVPNYAAEAYDAADIELAGIEHGVRTRTAMITWVRSQHATGVTQRFAFTRTGELTAPNAWAYVVKQGKYSARRIA